MKNRFFIAFIIATILVVVFDHIIKYEIIIGILPILLVGQIWNWKNALLLYQKIKIPNEFNINTFQILNVIGVVYLILYMIILNYIMGDFKVRSSIFLPITGLTNFAALAILFYSINFVTRGVQYLTRNSMSKWKIRLSILFYPIGILWLQPKIDEIVE